MAGSQVAPVPAASVALSVTVDPRVWLILVAEIWSVFVVPGVKLGSATVALLALVTASVLSPRSAWTATLSCAGGPALKPATSHAGGPGAIFAAKMATSTVDRFWL
jgi:hypothetical protein